MCPEGESCGDPYITPIYGHQYKLPDKEASYRLFERGNVFINGVVRQASQQKQQDIIKYTEEVYAKCASKQSISEVVKLLSVDNLILDGYFYDEFLISSENQVLYVDLKTKQFKSSPNAEKYFAINQTDKQLSGTANTTLYKNSKFTEVAVTWSHSEFGNMNTNVSFYENPQIDNGISISESMTSKDSIGLLVRNYKPKLMEIANIKTLTNKKLHKHLKNAKHKFINKAIIGNKEKWISVRDNEVISLNHTF